MIRSEVIKSDYNSQEIQEAFRGLDKLPNTMPAAAGCLDVWIVYLEACIG